jgi:hypothetical protein
MQQAAKAQKGDREEANRAKLFEAKLLYQYQACHPEHHQGRKQNTCRARGVQSHYSFLSSLRKLAAACGQPTWVPFRMHVSLLNCVGLGIIATIYPI